MVPQLAEQLAKRFPLTDIETRQHRLNLPIVNPKRLLHQLAAAPVNRISFARMSVGEVSRDTNPNRPSRSTTPVTLGGRIINRSLRSVNRKLLNPSASARCRLRSTPHCDPLIPNRAKCGCITFSRSPYVRIRA